VKRKKLPCSSDEDAAFHVTRFSILLEMHFICCVHYGKFMNSRESLGAAKGGAGTV
jgi:hypothetical protein